MDISEQIKGGFSLIQTLGYSPFFIALGLSAVLGHAILQMLKDLTPARTWYQHWWVHRWIEEKSIRAAMMTHDIKGNVPSPNSASASLVNLATGGDADAFYGLPAEQMVAQINAAVQVVLDYPPLYQDLFLIVSQGITPDDANTILAPVKPSPKSKIQLDYQAARNRVGHRIQRNLDAFQISLDSDWTWLMQITCLVISILVVEAGVIATGAYSTETLVLGGAIGALGGYFGPVVNDVVSAVRGLNA